MWICQTHVLTKYYQGEVYLPTNAAQTKIDKLRAMIGDNKNIELKFHAEDCVEVFFLNKSASVAVLTENRLRWRLVVKAK
jgi:hypothetical protein